MKSFAEFLGSLSQEDKDYLLGTGDEPFADFKGDPEDPYFFQELMAYHSEIAFAKSLRLLEMYHHWLLREIELTSDRQ